MPLQVLLISTYELGHQPFGLASPAAWLRAEGARVSCLDLAVQALDEAQVRAADLIACYVPMHTATRLAATALPRLRALNQRAHICCYGLYAPVNERYLRGLGADTILGGEFEAGLVALARRLAGGGAGQPQAEPLISLARQQFRTPDRSGLPALQQYAHLDLGRGKQRTVGYTEASRGCKHMCRHCPIVPVYGGRFRIVQRDVVLQDIEHQVAAGAQHITFGDPDFLNGPGHAIPLVRELHARFPSLTYDVTIKVEHLLKHAGQLETLRDTGCLFVTSAVEAVDDGILQKFDKHHSRADFVRAVGLLREVGLALNPTFVTFTPWTTLQGYLDLLRLINALELVENVAPIQYAIRLLIPAGSRLLELPDIQQLVGAYDEMQLCYPWAHPDQRVDQLYQQVRQFISAAQARQVSRRASFDSVWQLAHEAAGLPLPNPVTAREADYRPQPVPWLSEPWYC